MTDSETIQLVQRLARRDESRSEASIQADVRQLLKSGVLNLDQSLLEDLSAELESSVKDKGGDHIGRIDIEIGTCIIEVKKKVTSAIEKEVVNEQLHKYLTNRLETTGVPHTGILTDGRIWKLFAFKRGKLTELNKVILDPKKPDVKTLIRWLEAVFASSKELPARPDSVAAKLGANSPTFDLDIDRLATLYSSVKKEPDVELKRSLWRKSLSTALGTQFKDTDQLFVEHTYLVIVAELIAHAAMGLEIPNLDPQVMISGERFHELGLRGVVEPDFFDWVTASIQQKKRETGRQVIIDIGKRVNQFDWRKVDHDVLKSLYESVIDQKTRHEMGEYYTPDWLANEIVVKLVTNPLGQRVLDPSCGSGTFLFAAIQNIKRSATLNKSSPYETLQAVIGNVSGVDLHPVAVTLARVTYLLALGSELLKARRGEGLLIPVFLGDSVQWDSKDTQTLFGQDELVIRTESDDDEFKNALRFPLELLEDAQKFDRLIAQMAEHATITTSNAKQQKLPPALRSGFNISDEKWDVLQTTYQTMRLLHDSNRDNIWGYYVRNLARPLWMSRRENRVDLLVGNPPWLAFRYMPKEMQASFKRRCDELEVRPKGKLATQADLSSFFVVNATQKYLKDGGKFGFVMPRGVLSGPHYKDFRRAEYPTNGELVFKFDEPWDLGKVRPHIFPVPSCVIFGSKLLAGKSRSKSATSLPEDHQQWKGEIPPESTSVPASVKRISHQVRSFEGSEFSAYHSLATQGASFSPRSLLFVVKDESDSKTSSKTLKLIRSRRSGDKEPWKSLPDLRGAVEPRFLRKVALGSTLLHFGLVEPEKAVIPWDGKHLLDSSSLEMKNYPGLFSWWSKAERRWDEHSSGKMSLLQRIDYQKLLTQQFPTAKIRVVYSTSGTYLASAVIDDQTLLCDTKTYWIPVSSLDEGHYLSAILNSDALRNRFAHLQPMGQFGTRDFHRLPLCPPTPLYDPKSDMHHYLSQIYKDASTHVATMNFEQIGFIRARQNIRKELKANGLLLRLDKLVEKLLADS